MPRSKMRYYTDIRGAALAGPARRTAAGHTQPPNTIHVHRSETVRARHGDAGRPCPCPPAARASGSAVCARHILRNGENPDAKYRTDRSHRSHLLLDPLPRCKPARRGARSRGRVEACAGAAGVVADLSRSAAALQTPSHATHRCSLRPIIRPMSLTDALSGERRLALLLDVALVLAAHG